VKPAKFWKNRTTFPCPLCESAHAVDTLATHGQRAMQCDNYPYVTMVSVSDKHGGLVTVVTGLNAGVL
jgi:hypothetical protein